MTVPKIDNTTNTIHVQIHANAAGVEVKLVDELAILLAATHATMKAHNTNTNDNNHAMVITFLALVSQQNIRFRQHTVKSNTRGSKNIQKKKGDLSEIVVGKHSEFRTTARLWVTW